MLENMIKVRSESDSTLVINLPDMPLRKIWTKRGQIYPIDRQQLEIAYYNLSVESLFKAGLLTTDDKQFMKDVGLMTEDEKTEIIVLDGGLMARMLKLMPIEELKNTLNKLSQDQKKEVAEYAIEHNSNLSMDRIDLLSKATGKNLFEAIKNFKAAKEN